MFIDDSTGTLSAADKAVIESSGGSIDVKIVIASTGSRAELDAQVGRLVNSGNTLAIGIDPVHRYTFTHFGSRLGIPASDFQTIAHAGNADFKAGNWAGGLRAIIGAARADQHELALQTMIVPRPVTVIEHPVSPWPFVIGGLVIIVLTIAAWRWLRRRQQESEQVLGDFREEADKLRSRNDEEQTWHDRMAARQQRAQAPVPLPLREQIAAAPPLSGRPMTIVRERVIERQAAPVIVQQQASGNDMLTGMLIGQAIAQPRVVEVERHRSRTPAPEPSSSSSSWDSGSSSSWDSGSSGGGFDSGGGGGFDSGSGGGDF